MKMYKRPENEDKDSFFFNPHFEASHTERERERERDSGGRIYPMTNGPPNPTPANRITETISLRNQECL